MPEMEKCPDCGYALDSRNHLEGLFHDGRSPALLASSSPATPDGVEKVDRVEALDLKVFWLENRLAYLENTVSQFELVLDEAVESADEQNTEALQDDQDAPEPATPEQLMEKTRPELDELGESLGLDVRALPNKSAVVDAIIGAVNTEAPAVVGGEEGTT